MRTTPNAVPADDDGRRPSGRGRDRRRPLFLQSSRTPPTWLFGLASNVPSRPTRPDWPVGLACRAWSRNGERLGPVIL